MDEARLAAWLSEAAGAPVAIRAASLLTGGAIQQNWALSVTRGSAQEEWVLRTDNAATLAVSLPRLEEFALFQAAHAAGVTVPEPLFACADTSVLGAPFFVMRRVAGSATAHRLAKAAAAQGGDDALVASLGRELARIHRITPPRAELGFLGDPPADPALAFVASMRARLDAAGTPRPVMEWGLEAMARHAPPPLPPVLNHNDFRTGNIMVEGGRLTAVLDWEFAAWGDPHADLGWFCAPCWRFGNRALEAGGLGSRAAFLAGYAEEAGAAPDPDRLPFWELAATIRWAVIAADQGARHLSGRERGLELALTAQIVPELELDILAQVDGLDGVAVQPTAPEAVPRHAPSPLLEAPDAADLLATAREALLGKLLPALPPALHYEARMAANAIAIASRAIGVAPDDAPDLAALAAGIRAGTERGPQVRALLRRLTDLRCAISNPRALGVAQ
ncbi:phosphotransferase [Roseococcus suduntuyensis]|uniref:Aminoglycoside phosphotransferase (APT) family kinase protein n=1 Tax=Roseococcus suduntuyensis TaxID=455361 RepID=A0A840AF82_9PROT|nr:phosphotransferase [Roseococcus suduntuyensis]MBB3898755.1 aminoglycoside phosphotransferase (APT) family kinase protein [Roseococcus suduntuyensis]